MTGGDGPSRGLTRLSRHGFELSPGTLLSSAAACKTIVNRPTRDVGFPLVFGAVCGLLSLGLLAAAIVTAFALPATLLVVLELGIAAGLGWLALALIPDALAAHRFNRRRHEIRFEPGYVELRSIDGVERVPLADAPTHPFLRSLAIDQRIHTLVRVRAACERLPPRGDVRLILETLALEVIEEEPSLDGAYPPPPRPLFAFIAAGEARIFRDPDALAELRAEGLTLYRIDTEWNPESRAHEPRLVPAAVRRA